MDSGSRGSGVRPGALVVSTSVETGYSTMANTGSNLRSCIIRVSTLPTAEARDSTLLRQRPGCDSILRTAVARGRGLPLVPLVLGLSVSGSGARSHNV